MPTYDYRCAKCGEDLEVYQTFSEAPLTRHKGCGGKLSKVLSPAGIVLKGSGFYKTDNRSSGKRSSSDGAGKDSSSTNGDSAKSTDSKSSESKTSSESKSGSGSSSDSKKPAAKSA
jgi:putative FmdB family regulatory protein